jgi:uncharacterized lipoprotein YmbA
LPKAKPDPTRFYVLTSLSEMASSGDVLPVYPGRGDLSIGLGPIRLPGYLDREHIVTRESPNRIDVSEFDRWAEPLATNVKRVLAKNLSTLLGTGMIYIYPFSRYSHDYEIQIDVLRFETIDDRSAELAARWSIKDGKTSQILDTRDSNVKKPARSWSVAGSVEALSEALGELSSQIATGIREVDSKPKTGQQ